MEITQQSSLGGLQTGYVRDLQRSSGGHVGSSSLLISVLTPSPAAPSWTPALVHSLLASSAI